MTRLTASAIRAMVTAGFVLAVCTSATAQTPESDFDTPARVNGWTTSPLLMAGTVWDDNVLIQSTDDAPQSDLTTIFNPSGSVDYVGRKTFFSAAYNAGFTMYRSFSDLNSFEYGTRVSASRRLTAFTTISAHQSYASYPTTAMETLVGLPFVRLGSRVGIVGTAVESALTKVTSVTGSYDFEWVRFEEDPALGRPLGAGHSHKGRLGLRRRLGPRATATVDYDVLRGLTSGGPFSIHNAWLGGDYRLTDRVSVFGNIGIARLDTPDLRRETMPAWRTGLTRRLRDAEIEILYGRTFVPSYGGGGTQANQELTTRFTMPVARRGYSNVAVVWRGDKALFDEDELPLRSLWLSGTVGYAVRSWLRIEGFYSGLHQRIDRPGGTVNRSRVGVQVSTGTPMRIR